MPGIFSSPVDTSRSSSLNSGSSSRGIFSNPVVVKNSNPTVSSTPSPIATVSQPTSTNPFDIAKRTLSDEALKIENTVKNIGGALLKLISPTSKTTVPAVPSKPQDVNFKSLNITPNQTKLSPDQLNQISPVANQSASFTSSAQKQANSSTNIESSVNKLFSDNIDSLKPVSVDDSQWKSMDKRQKVATAANDFLTAMTPYGEGIVAGEKVFSTTSAAVGAVTSAVLNYLSDPKHSVKDAVLNPLNLVFGIGAGVHPATKGVRDILTEGEHPPQDLINEVLSNKLEKTPEGKQLLSTAVEAQNKNKVISVDTSNILKEQASKSGVDLPTSFSSPEEKQSLVELSNNPDKFVNEYLKNNTKENGTIHINSDQGMKVNSSYSGTNTKDYTTFGGNLAKLAYNKALSDKSSLPDSEKYVLILGGGTGSGKSSLSKFTEGRYPIQFDSTLSNYDRAKTNIDSAINKGFKVDLQYIYRDPVKAYEEGVLQRYSEGERRTVPISTHINSHINANEVITKLYDEYKTNPSVNIDLWDNSGGYGEAKRVNIDFVRGREYNKSELQAKLYDITKQASDKGQINEGEFKALTESKIRQESKPLQQGITREEPSSINKTETSKSVIVESRNGPGKETNLSTPSEDLNARSNLKNRIEDLKVKIHTDLMQQSLTSEAKGQLIQNLSSQDLKDISDLRKTVNSKAGQSGDIETLYKTNPELTKRVLDRMREVSADYLTGANKSDSELLDMALSMPSKRELSIHNPPEYKELKTLQDSLVGLKNEGVSEEQFNKLNKEYDAYLEKKRNPKIVEVSRSQIPIGEGKTKVSRLEARMKESLGNLTNEDIERLGLSTYKKLSNKENVTKAVVYVLNHPTDAIKILKGEMEAPPGILRNAIYVAMENEAKGNVNLARTLASISSTRLGQEISILREINPNSPVKIMQDLIQIKEAALVKKYGGRSVKQITDTFINKGEKEIKPPKILDWESIIKDIIC